MPAGPLSSGHREEAQDKAHNSQSDMDGPKNTVGVHCKSLMQKTSFRAIIDGFSADSKKPGGLV